MKPSFTSAMEQLAGTSPLRRYRPSASRPVSQSSRPDSTATRGRWLTTLPVDLDVAREGALSALSAVSADLAYLYHADDKVVIRAIDEDRQIRIEIMPVDARSTRISVVCTHEGEVDRSLSTRVMRTIEANLS